MPPIPAPHIHHLALGYFVTMPQNISDQHGEQMGSWAEWDSGEVAWRSPPAPVLPSLSFQGSTNPRSGALLPVSISCIRMWDLLISAIRSPPLPRHWWCLSLAFFSYLRSTLKLLQSEIFQLKVEQIGKREGTSKWSLSVQLSVRSHAAGTPLTTAMPG